MWEISSLNQSDRTIDSFLDHLDAPRVTASSSIIAVDQFTSNVALNCEIDSFPEAKVFWKFNQQDLVPSSRYTIVQNETSSSLIVKQIQSIHDYGIYTCHAINQLADRFVTIQLRSKGRLTYPSLNNVDWVILCSSYCVCSFHDHYHIKWSLTDLPLFPTVHTRQLLFLIV